MRRTLATIARPPRPGAIVILALTAGLLVACGSDDSDDASASGPTSGQEATTTEATTTTEPTTTAPPSTTTTTAPPTTTTTAPPPPPPPPPGADADGVLRPGETGDAVAALQQKLTDLGYWLSAADGSYGLTTQQAVMAFQKAEGLGRDGIAGAETLTRLQSAGRVTAASTSGRLIEIDLARQLLFVIDNGRVVWAFNTSTGTASTPTRPGNFTINREINGMRNAPLGQLWMPKYFDGGRAIHGSTSIPGYPASHSCARVSNPAIEWLWASGYVEMGAAVWVH
ncbi:MAG: L,D-transpeptidase family protein [Acidimicrobiales bacterium]